VAEVIRADADLPARLERVFAEEGFAPGVFAPFFHILAEPVAQPVDYPTLLSSSAASLVRTFRVSLGERVGILTFLNGVADGDALEARLAGQPNVLFLRQSDLWRDAQRAYQDSTARLLLIGLAAVLALLGLRYRDLRRTVVSFVPSALAAGVTVCVLALLGRGVDLISLTALLFVVSMGVDYSVFLVDAADDPDGRSVAAALTGALLAGVSTVAAFGLLGTSMHPVLSSLGLTAAVGIGTSLLLAPVTLLLLHPSGMQAKEAEAVPRSSEAGDS
jgi:predicted exporter